MKLWLDDLREPPAGWVWVRTPEETIAQLETGEIDELSLDHDLGIWDESGHEQTGYDVLRWIEQRVATAGMQPPKLTVHSANPPAHDRMQRAIESIMRRAAQQQ